MKIGAIGVFGDGALEIVDRLIGVGDREHYVTQVAFIDYIYVLKCAVDLLVT